MDFITYVEGDLSNRVGNEYPPVSSERCHYSQKTADCKYNKNLSYHGARDVPTHLKPWVEGCQPPTSVLCSKGHHT